jgi:predicted PurR-regulated permease PerM
VKPLAYPRKLAYVLFAVITFAVITLHLAGAALTGLFSYMILDLTFRPLSKVLKRWPARLVSILIFLVVSVLLVWLLGHFLKLTFAKLPAILDVAIPRLDELAGRFGIDLPFENLTDLRATAIETLKENLHSLTRASGVLTHGFFQIFVGVFTAIAYFLSDRKAQPEANLLDAVRREFGERVKLFMEGFEIVFGAQFAISAINTILTGVFLAVVQLPYLKFLTISTFILGLLPVIGLAASNTLIMAAALMISPKLSLFCLAFLVFLHKMEFIVRGHYIGMTSDMPMWQVLLVVLVGEALMGVAGIIVAPAFLHYAREELRLIRYEA